MLFDTKITACPCSASALGEKVEVVEKRGKSCPPMPCMKRVAWVGKFDGIATCGRSLEPRMAPYSRSLGSLPPVPSDNEKSTGLFRWVIDGMKTARNSDPTDNAPWPLGHYPKLHVTVGNLEWTPSTQQKRFSCSFECFSELHSMFSLRDGTKMYANEHAPQRTSYT